MVSSKSRIVSNIKNEELINLRRQELVNAAVKLFVEKGFHKTTVREIAKEFEENVRGEKIEISRSFQKAE